MVRKRPPLSFPELDSRGRGAILRSSAEVRAEQELLDARGSELVPAMGELDLVEQSTSRQVGKATSGQAATSTSGHVGKSTSPQTDLSAKPLVRKYTTHLRPETVKAVRRIAFDSERKDYQIVQEALDQYLERLSRAGPEQGSGDLRGATQ